MVLFHASYMISFWYVIQPLQVWLYLVPVSSYLTLKNVLQTDGQTDRQTYGRTDGNAISMAERLLRNAR